MNAKIPPMNIADKLEIVRQAYETVGEDFRYLPTTNVNIGYYVEPWTNECLVGPKLTSDQPAPVSVEESDDEITRHEERIRTWIAAEAHPRILRGIVQGAPVGWIHLGDRYLSDWFDGEFGATVVMFRMPVGPTNGNTIAC